MQNYYFTFGTSMYYPRRGGWIVVQAPTIEAAIRVFSAYYPPEDGITRFSCVYAERDFMETRMYVNGNYGAKCHLIIGPHQMNQTEKAEEEKQMKIFISGKITGDPNYREKFEKAEKELTAQGHLVMNPAVFPEGFTWEEYMKITLAMLSVCDTIYLLPDWTESKGAQEEFKYATAHGLTIILQPQKAPNRNND